MSEQQKQNAASGEGEVVNRVLRFVKGAVLPQTISLNSPPLRKAFTHQYDIADAHLYFIMVYSRATLPEEVIQPEIGTVRALLTRVLNEVGGLQNMMSTLAAKNGVAPGAFLKDHTLVTQATTPGSKLYLELFQKCDAYLALVDALWIEGVIGDEQHGKAAKSMGQLCSKTGMEIQAVFRKLLQYRGPKTEVEDGELNLEPKPSAGGAAVAVAPKPKEAAAS